MKATNQQRAAIEASKLDNDIAVNAGPGSGKTQLLSMIAEAKPGIPIVNFCFNRNTKLQADKRMPTWVKNFTFHGAAYSYCGKFYAHKLKTKILPHVIVKRFGCDEHVATVAKYAIRRFATSDSECITGWHVPKAAILGQRPENQETFKNDVVTVARKVWRAAMDHTDREFGIEHDFYAKKWADEGAKLAGRYDTIMIDESQDMVKSNVKAISYMSGQKIAVGDRNQQLYDFRQTVNIEDEMSFMECFDLTISHRFGQAIADVANQVLDLMPGKQPHLIGVGGPSRIDHGRPEGRHVVLCRSNSGLLIETLDAIRRGQQVHIVGSLIESIMLIESAWYLSIGENNKVRHPMLKMIGDWNTVVEMANEDADLAVAVKRVDSYGSSIPNLCDELRQAGETSRERADVVLSTVHKFKGDQCDAVKLSDDFPDLIRWNKKQQKYVPQKSELCVFYVAVTRAKKVLYTNSSVAQLNSWKELLNVNIEN